MAQSQQLTALGIDCGSHTFVATLAQSTAGATPSYAIVRNSLSNSETPAIFACSSSRLMVGEAAVAERETGGNKYPAPTLGLAAPPNARLPVLTSEFGTAVFGSDGLPLMPYGDGASFSFQHMVGSLVMEVSAPVRSKSDAASVSFVVTSPFADLEFARAMKDAAFITRYITSLHFSTAGLFASIYLPIFHDCLSPAPFASLTRSAAAPSQAYFLQHLALQICITPVTPKMSQSTKSRVS